MNGKNKDFTIKSEELNSLWQDFLEKNIMWFLMKNINEESIEQMKKVRLEKLNKYMDDLGTGEGVLYWRVVLSFRYKDEGFSLDSQETEPQWYFFDWENDSSIDEELTYEIEEIFTGRISDSVLNYFLETVLDKTYDLGI